MNSPISEDKKMLVSPGHYCSVASHKSNIYAAYRDLGAIEIYSHSGDTWWGLRRIYTPIDAYDTIRLWVNDTYIFASSYFNDAIFVYNHDGTLHGKHDVHGSSETGQLYGTLLCHGDDDGDVLIADYYNHRLQVLYSDGAFSVVNIPYMRYPRSAVYTPGRLYVLEWDPSSNRNRIDVYLPDQIKVGNVEQENE